MTPPPGTQTDAGARHTEGKWYFEPHNGYGAKDFDGNPWPFGYLSCNLLPIFELNLIVGGYSDDELVANARLIAAAPEMLAALKACISYRNWQLADGSAARLPSEFVDTFRNAEAAIAAAEGRS